VNRRWADAALAANTVLWGATFILVKAALRDVSPVLFLAMRLSLAAVVLAVAFRGGIKSGGPLRGGVLAGIFLFGGFYFQTQGLRLTTAPKSAFITGLCTVMVPLVGALVYTIRPQLSEVVGVLVATLGLGLMTLEGPIGSIGRGDVLTLLGAITFAGHIVTVGHFAPVSSFQQLTFVQLATAAACALLACIAETPRIAWSPAVIAAILVTGLLCTALAFAIQAWAQRYTTATRTGLIYALEPVVAWITSFVVTGETLAARAVAGAALILGGVILVEVKPLDSAAHPKH
jgi:drug/metabolite transporter (DMT)-like permease